MIANTMAEIILEDLMKKNIISKETLLGILLTKPTTELKRATDLIHALFCKGHVHGEQTCKYREEEAYDDCWNKTEHQEWLKTTLEFMSEYNLESEAQLFKLFNQANPVVTMLSQLELENPSAFRLVLHIKSLRRNKS